MQKNIFVIFVSGMIFFQMTACRSNYEQAEGIMEISTQSEVIQETESEPESITDEKVYIDICGAVVKPGVYEVDRGSRLFEVLRMAGGFSEDADREYINQARTVEDGEQIRFPTREEAEKYRESGNSEQMNPVSGDSVKSSTAAGNGKININNASGDQLCTIPGVGTAKAESIIQYREEHGPFGKTEDIMQVTGIKQGMYDKMKEHITVQ